MSNPALNDKTFSGLDRTGERMSVAGTVNKTAILLALLLATAMITWSKVFAGDMAAASMYMLAGIGGGLVFALITIFFNKAAPFTAPAYALCEGLAIGGLSATFEQRYPGIAIQATLLTFGTLGAMLVAYKTGLLRMSDRMRKGIILATGAIAILYLVDLVMALGFHMPISFIHESGPVGILFSLVVVGIAAFNLLIDFEVIERGAREGAPRYMEWYAAFGMMLTLVWLYMEVLRLLSKMRSR